MKKVFDLVKILLGTAVAVMLVSCASIPKKVKPGDTLVIGRIEVDIKGAQNFEDVEFNGRFHDGIELTIMESKTKKEKTIYPDEDGFFYISGLKAHEPYQIKSMKITRYGYSGASMWHELPVAGAKNFIPYDNIVVNIGCLNYDIDYEANYYETNYSNYYYVKDCFERLNFESEWFDKEIVDQR